LGGVSFSQKNEEFGAKISKKWNPGQKNRSQGKIRAKKKAVLP